MYQHYKYLLFFIALCIQFIGTPSSANEANAAVASNFTITMRQLVKDFEANSLHTMRVSYGSSGKIYAQIMNGAPFHLFLSADQEKPIELISHGAAIENSRFTYATGALSLWTQSPGLKSNAEVLTQAENKYRLAIANPKLAPYGRAAQQVIDKLRLDKSDKVKLIYGENIAQTFQFVSTRNAQYGLVANAQLKLLDNISPEQVWPIPAHLHQAIKQDAVLLKRGQDNQAALAFMDFLRSSKAQDIIASHGYQ